MDFNDEIKSLNLEDLDIEALERRLELAKGVPGDVPDGWLCGADGCGVNCGANCTGDCGSNCVGNCYTLCAANYCDTDYCGGYGCSNYNIP